MSAVVRSKDAQTSWSAVAALVVACLRDTQAEDVKEIVYLW